MEAWTLSLVVSVKGFMARVWKWLKHPAATGVLGLSIVADVAIQRYAPMRNPVSSWSAFRRPTRTDHFAGWQDDEVSFYRAVDGSIVMADSSGGSLGEFAAVLSDRPQDAIRFVVTSCGHLMEGPWAAVRQREQAALWMSEYVKERRSSFTPAEIAECRVRVAEWLKSLRFPEDRVQSLMTTGEFSEIRPLWSGYLYNTASLVLVVLFALSLSWIPGAPAYLASTRRARRLARGECPKCRYSVMGLKEPMCPECGCSLDRTAEDPPVETAAGG